jgi:hypothetical protein
MVLGGHNHQYWEEHPMKRIAAGIAAAAFLCALGAGTASADPGMTHNAPPMTHNSGGMTHNAPPMTHNSPGMTHYLRTAGGQAGSAVFALAG